MLSLAQRIRALQPEIIYDLAPERTAPQSARDRFFFRKLVGVKDYRGGGLLHKPPKTAQGVLPRIEPEWKRLLGVIVAEVGNTDFRLSIPPAEQQRAPELLAREGVGGNVRILAVGPGSKMPAKRWARDQFHDLGRQLLAAYPELHLLIAGGREGTAIGDDLCAAWGKRSHNAAGRLSILGSAAVLRECLGYVGNDTGVMDLASMVGIPCVALFSARDYPGQWEPYGTGRLILRHETDCAGCMLTICPYDNKCLSLVSTAEAVQAVGNIITIY